MSPPWRGDYEDPADGQLSADDQPRLRLVTDDYDYGGKTREQEATDSMAMLGLVLVALAAIAVIVGLVVVVLWAT